MNRAAAEFIRTLDLDAMARLGCSYTDPRFDPLRLGKPLVDIDTVRDYDFERLEDAERKLRDVDRRLALIAIGDRLCHDLASWQVRHLAVLGFLQRVSFNHYIQACWRDGTLVRDPLLLLLLNEMRCGQVACLAVDLFESLGGRARAVQLGGHTIAEFWYDDGWHYCDADLFDGDELETDADGTIPSVAQLSRDPHRIDAPAHHFYQTWKCVAEVGGAHYPSYHYFSSRAYGRKGPRYTYKRTRRHCVGRDFGWTRTRERRACDIRLYDLPLVLQPGAPMLQAVTIAPMDGFSWATITWSPSRDPSSDLARYRVLVGTRPRGWNYQTSMCRGSAVAFRNDYDGWRPDMYPLQFLPPPSDVLETTTSNTSISIQLTSRPLYVTVWAEGKHGLAHGKRHWFHSDELVLPARDRGSP